MLDDKKWVELNSFPGSIFQIDGVFEINNVLYVVSYEGVSTLNNDFYKYPSVMFHCFSSCKVENNILLIGSYKQKSKLFNTTNKQWSDVDVKTNRKDYDVVYYLNQFWIVGGREDIREKNGLHRRFYALNTTQIFDPVNKTEVLSSVEMIQARRDHKVIVYNNKLFVFGGFDGSEILNTVEMYEPGMSKFIMMAPMKTARKKFACCRVGNLVYIVGGVVGGSINYVFTRSVEIYDLDKNYWFEGEKLPCDPKNTYHACAVNN